MLYAHQHLQANYDLLKAIKNQDIQDITLALQQGADPATQDVSGISALQIGFATKNSEIIELLTNETSLIFDEISSVPSDTTDSNSPVQDESAQSDAQEVDENYRFFEQARKAIDENDRKKFYTILNASQYSILTTVDSKGRNLLMYAAHENQPDMIDVLLTEYSNINDQGNFGNTALIYAILNQSIQAIKRLLNDKDIDITIKNNEGLSAYDLAIQGKNKYIVNLLVEKFPHIVQQPIDNASPQALLLQAIEQHNLENILHALSDGADINAKDAEGKTPLMLAAQCGGIEVVQLLIEQGANLKAKDKNGMTAFLISAASTYNDDPIHKLIATGSNNSNVVDYLLHINPELINEVNNKKWTALMLAVASNNMATISRLLHHDKISINAQNDDGNTALMIAVNNNNADIVNLLIGQGVEWQDLLNNKRQSAFKIAEVNDNSKIIKIFQNDIERNLYKSRK